MEPQTGNSTQPNADAAFDIVALAASAGGLTALSRVLAALPDGFPATLVVVQHLDPRHRSLMADILSRRTPLRVKQAEEGEQVGPATVYIAPPNRHLLVNPDGTLSLTQSKLVHFLRPSADLLFESVAASYGERAIAVVLTGTGSDGAMGVQAIKKMGGTVIAQDEATAEFFGMPSAAIHSGSVDFVLPLDEIATALVTLVMKGEADMSAPLDEPGSTQEFETLVEYLKNNRGFDFTGYKRSSLRRRVGKRMQSLRIERYSDYLDYLEVHPEEFIQLFNTILINVTSFFRDTAAWEFLVAEVIPQLIAGKQPHEPIRVWSAGCASGEEAYSLAMVLAEALGLESFRQRVKIYATDVDEEALVQARQASYSAARPAAGVP